MFAFLAFASFPQQLRTLRGTVVDLGSVPIPAAAIEFQSPSGTQTATTDSDGEFFIANAAKSGTLVVRHAGFETVNLAINADTPSESIKIRMAPSTVVERIQVSADEGHEITPTPTSQFVISTEMIDQSASLEIDDVLREVPGFTLFRRSSSLFANPTTQGVSLRGVGANGASRANVLVDGIPLNDPFGGWVYWSQVPIASVQDVDIVNGGASDTYGGGALGGVINITSRRVDESFATAEISYGTLNTPFLSFDAGTVVHGWAMSIASQSVETTGYILVPASQRGSIDTRAGTADWSGALQLSHKIGAQGNFFLRWTDLAEKRQNGTPDQTNNTRLPSLDIGLDWQQPTAGSFSVRAYASNEVFNQNFSAISANRNSETLTDTQRSPSYQVGGAAQWQRTFRAKHVVTAGVEARDVRGHSYEITSNATGPTADVDAGGNQSTIGYFAQDAYLFAQNWLLTFGGRVDTWRNSAGFANRFPLPGGPLTSNGFPNRWATAFSPRLSLMHAFEHGIEASASVYRAFRAPTLNELYRNFRVGNVVTDANPALTAETLTGGEAGVSVQRWQGKFIVRGNFFWSDIENPVANVTLSTTPTLITRERENLGVIQARGGELSAELRLPKHLFLTGGYILSDSRVKSFPAEAVLVGLQVPQVAKNQFNIQIAYARGPWTVSAQTRFVGNQFDDDQNLLPLGRAFIADMEISHRVRLHGSIFAAAQNLLNDRYAVARTPVTNIGPPPSLRVGLRLAWPER
jgi:outer membrane receptor protein involved in Fe transport